MRFSKLQYRAEVMVLHLMLKIYVIWLPVIIVLAVYAAIFAEAGKLGLQVELTLATFEAAHMPLFVHRQQVVAVGNLPPAAGTQGHSVAVDRR